MRWKKHWGEKKPLNRLGEANYVAGSSNSKVKDKLSVVCGRGIALVIASSLDPMGQKKSEGRGNVLKE